MLKVLISAYTCCPNMGSEQGMGWNFITYLAKHCELYVISEGEYKEQCEEVSKDLPIHWYWNIVPQSTREKCWNQGNWSFYPLYKKWQEKTADIARDICSKEKIDILHQLNMIGFREPGFLAKVSKETGIPLVWGPIGGLKKFPMEYASGLKMKTFNWLKNTITEWQIHYDKRVAETLRQASVLVASIPDSYNAIKRCHGRESVIIPETGCFTDNIQISEGEMDVWDKDINHTPLSIMWVGKFDYRKRLDIALKALAIANTPSIILKVFGTGNEKQVANAKALAHRLKIDDHVQFMGSQSNDIVKKEMRKADVFLFTSVNEDTSTVVLEAISNRLPVICFDCCGMAAVIDEKVGIKIPLTNPKQSAMDISRIMIDILEHREILVELASNCVERAMELSWEKKALKIVALYKQTEKTRVW